MYSKTYYFDKVSGTYSDPCGAYGLAYLLSRVLQDGEVPSDVTIKDAGTTYVLETTTPLTPEIVSRAEYPSELLPFIQNEPHPEGAKHFPLSEYIGLLKRPASAAAEGDAEVAAMTAIPDDFSVYSLFSTLQVTKSGTTTGVWERLAGRLWDSRKEFCQILRMVLTIYSESPNLIDSGREMFTAWRKQISTSFPTEERMGAALNPSSQKSINAAKPAGPKDENMDGFWLPEWLKMIGMPKSALVVGIRFGRDSFADEDKKVYAVAPIAIALSRHDSIMKSLRAVIRPTTSIKADIEVLLRYVEALLQYIPRRANRRRTTTRDYVDGFSCAYFKKSGSQRTALSLTNLPYLQLPEWVEFGDIPTAEEIGNYQEIIQHQREVLFYRYLDNGKYTDFLDENQNEGCTLLRHYREFLSGGDTNALLDFYAGFASLLMQSAGRGKPYRQFALSQIRRLFVTTNPTLQQMLDNEGFREVARAIRLTTVTAQRFKELKKKGVEIDNDHHEIQYGLAQELKRKAPFKKDFTTTIMTFINQYQAENARARERGESNIHEVTTTDVQQLAQLIDACPGEGAEPLASLLIAYGYAYDDTSRKKVSPTDGTQGIEGTSTDTLPEATQ